MPHLTQTSPFKCSEPSTTLIVQGVEITAAYVMHL